MKKMNVLSLMISCPSDVSDEVKTVEDVVRTINNTIGLSAGFVIRTLFWKECVIPTAGKSAQDIINEQVLSRADAVFGEAQFPPIKYMLETLTRLISNRCDRL